MLNSVYIRRNEFLLLPFAISLYLFYPLITSYLILTLSSLFVKRFSRYLIYFSSALSLGIVSYTKQPYSDLLVYYQHFSIIEEFTLLELLESYKIEQVFYVLSWVLLKFFDASKAFVLLFWVTLTYFISFVSIDLIGRYLKTSRIIVSLLCSYLLFFGYNLSLVNHLLRQYAAFSFVFIAFASCINGRSRAAIIYFTIAFFMHSSTILYSPILIFMMHAHKVSRKLLFFIFMLMFIISILLGFKDIIIFIKYIPAFGVPYLEYIKLKFSSYSYVPDFDINYRYFIERFSFVFLSCFYLVLLLVVDDYKKNRLIFFVIFYFYIIMLLLFRNTDILFFRHQFILPIFFSISVLYIFSLDRITKYSCFVVLFLYSTLAPFRFIRANSSNDSLTQYSYAGWELFAKSLGGLLNWY